MDVVVLTAVCAGGLALAVFFVVRWGGPRRLPMPVVVPGAPPSVWLTVRRMLRGLSMAFLAGGLAGVLTAGLGGRLMMRVIAATSGDRAQGQLTEAEETVGDITLDGTLGLVLFIGVFGGLLGGVLYLLLRRWLPRPTWGAGLVLGALALGLAPAMEALDPDSADFEILRPDALAVAMLVVLFPLFGMTVVAVMERADRSWPLLEWRPIAVAAHLPLLLMGPALVGVGLPFVIAFVVVLMFQHIPALGRLWRRGAVDQVARAVVGAVAVLALVWCGVNVVDILDGGGEAVLLD